jgi:hypothetical protein
MFHVLLRYQIMVLLVAINCYIVILLEECRDKIYNYEFNLKFCRLPTF